MAASQLCAVIDALVALARDVVDTDHVAVFDGSSQDHENVTDQVWIGHDGSDDSSAEAGSTDQDDVGLGTNNRRDERITVQCAVLCWQMENDAALPRDRAAAIVDDLGAAILADRTLGFPAAGAPGGVRNARIEDVSLHHFNNAAGAGARVAFTVTCTARL